MAAFRSFPAYCVKASALSSVASLNVNIAAAGSHSLRPLPGVLSGVQAAQVLVDTPPNYLTSQTYEDFVRYRLQGHRDVSIECIKWKELE